MLTNREWCKIICLKLIESEDEIWYAYKLRSFIETTYPQINLSNVYPTIRKMVEEKLVLKCDGIGEHQNDVAIFKLTEKGRDQISEYKDGTKHLVDILFGGENGKMN